MKKDASDSIKNDSAFENTAARTISDFGEQWTKFQTNEGYYGSVELLTDIFGPLLSTSKIEGTRVGEIGSGTGRIVNMLLDTGAREVVAVEPSEAFDILRENTKPRSERVRYLKARGEDIPADLGLDYIFSIGVLHHILDPRPVVEAAFRALRPGGRCLVWLYGREGNEAYLGVVEPLRRITTRLPHGALTLLCHVLNMALDVYLLLCKFIPLPLRDYMNEVIGKFTRKKRHLVIYDQLNPAYAKYYTRQDAHDLLAEAGFVDVQIFHRHNYSWTVAGLRPKG